MENPLKEIRMELQFTPNQLANFAGIHQTAVEQAEAGFYPQPLPSYLIAIGIKPGTSDEKKLIDKYHQFQLETRLENGPNGLCKLILNPRFTLDENPLFSWRTQSGLATYGFCSAFCVHMPSVNNFEKNIVKLGEVPSKAIAVPLTQAGYDLDEFTEASLLYKASLLNKVRSSNGLEEVDVEQVA